MKEIEEMIVTVDKNKDGKINYSEFRVGFENELTKIKSYKFEREKIDPSWSAKSPVASASSSRSSASSSGDAWRDPADHPGLPPAGDEEGGPQQGEGEEGGPQQGLDWLKKLQKMCLRDKIMFTHNDAPIKYSHFHVFYLKISLT